MNAMLTPANTAELVEAVRSTPRVIAVGAGTKPRLSAVNAVKLSTAKLSGMVEYEPSEFTFTALAGTPVREIAATLAARGQYLPFDPMWVDAGATLGGTVASGVSGPGRFRFGGLRDFILGVQFVDGAGRLLRLGGKVVKNAAGFDVPKFLVGSVGRFGVLVEITFKVFPQPASRLTLTLDVSDPESAVKILTAAANSRWELDALDGLPDGKSIALRLGGPATALPSLAREILGRWPGRVLSAEDANALWLELRECHWANAAGPLLKIAVSPSAVVTLAQSVSTLSGARMHLSAGGNVAFVSLAAADQVTTLDENLRAQKLSGVTLRGDAPLWLGARTHFKISQAVKAAFDAENRFPGLDD
jgi:glycolate oxidase FAD binding subunit